ncbi:NADH oxidase related protein [Carpediemonas membranifera]|uniref:NADH oxidase related protein n=1 Tax=Carpediemonas membranifera TaxID=201153 RepID=A0A8J6EAP8_9EUKA|nr:NADH oxidase related protein [Carpediemonas membranifera]|eukprot:KAG9395035.1 NADH oxidase related protein [Carpediemonas membranifera]
MASKTGVNATKTLKVIVIGCLAGGAAAACRVRRISEDAEIICIEKSAFPSFGSCGMPYVAGNTIEGGVDSLVVTSADTLINRFGVDLRLEQTVTAVDRASKTITVATKDGKTYTEAYDKLVMSTGTRPFIPPIKGLESGLPENVTGLLTPTDLASLIKLRDDGAKRCFVIGGGFIGVETAEQLAKLGLDVTICDMLPFVMNAVYDDDVAPALTKALEDTGVKTILGAVVESIEVSGGRAVSVTVKGRDAIPVDAVVMAAGNRPNSELATGMTLGPRGHIAVNEHMQTSDPDVYAVGDVVTVPHLVLGESWVPLAGPAQRQGRVAAGHIAGGLPDTYKGTMATSVIRVGAVVGASTGASERALRMAGWKQWCGYSPLSEATKDDDKAYSVVYTHNGTHVGYYPGSVPLHAKLIFHPTSGRILGAQIVSDDTAARRIDVIATAIKGGLTVEDLEETDLAYAPEFGSPKDAITMPGFVASGIMRGTQQGMPMTMLVKHLDELKAAGTVLDVRSAGELEACNLGEGVLNINVDELRGRLSDVPQDKPVFVFCRVGFRGYVAQRILEANGYEAYNGFGGMCSVQFTSY